MTIRSAIVYLCLCSLFVLMAAGCAEKKARQDAQHPASEFEIECKAPEEKGCPWPEGLLHGFSRYWSLRFSQDTEKAFAMEAPYFQYAATMERYELFVRGFQEFDLDRIEVFSIDYQTDYKVSISMSIQYNDKSGKQVTTSRRDMWVQVDGNWYHVIRNPIFFPELT